LDVAGKNEHIVTLIGRRLREAADTGRASELPESIRLGLKRLGDLKTIVLPSRLSGHPIRRSRVPARRLNSRVAWADFRPL
jgi:hypothetical protein